MKLARAVILAALLLALITELAALWHPVRTLGMTPSAMTHESGFAYNIPFSHASRLLIYIAPADFGDTSGSTLTCIEDGAPLGSPHAAHQDIREHGGGRFSFWGEHDPSLYFSSSDGSDPRTNGRRYSARIVMHLDPTAHAIGRWAAFVLLIIGMSWAFVAAAGSDERDALRRAGIVLAFGAVAAFVAWWSTGVPSVLAAAFTITAIGWLAGWGMGAAFGRPKEGRRRAASNAALMVASIGAMLVIAEASLALVARIGSGEPPVAPRSVSLDPQSLAEEIPLERARIEQAMARAAALSPEPEWSMQPLPGPQPEGADRCSLYYEKRHCQGKHGERLPRMDPPTEETRPTILVIGDSLTFGWGVGEEDRWSAVMRRELESVAPHRVLNLAACGFQSEQILGALERGLASCKPIAVIYGVCHNDLLPADRGQDSKIMRLPPGWVARSRAAAAVQAAVIGAQLRLGLAEDFYTDALRGGQGWADRFERDATAMVQRIRGADAVPIAMVLDAAPRMEGDGRTISLDMEARLSRAGFNVIPSETYTRRLEGIPLTVSRWEGHPNEIAHAFWARMFAQRIADLRPAPGTGPEVTLPSGGGSLEP